MPQIDIVNFFYHISTFYLIIYSFTGVCYLFSLRVVNYKKLIILKKKKIIKLCQVYYNTSLIYNLYLY